MSSSSSSSSSSPEKEKAMSAFPHTRPDYYLSRVAHVASGALLFAHAASPYLYSTGEPTFAAKWIPMGLVALSLFSGLYNAGAARPSRFGVGARHYRLTVYAGKTALLLLCTPLTRRLFATDVANAVTLAATSALIAVGSYLKYYREEREVRWMVGKLSN